MSEIKLKNLRDKDGGELFYPYTHVDAVLTNDGKIKDILRNFTVYNENTTEDGIIIKTNDDDVICKLDASCSDFRKLTVNGKELITTDYFKNNLKQEKTTISTEDISLLIDDCVVTKIKCEEKICNDEILFSNTEYSDFYFKIDQNGVYAKQYYDINGQKILNNTIPLKTSLIYRCKFENFDDFSNTISWSIENNRIINNNFGIDNRLILNKSFTMDPRLYICDFKVSENCEIFFGTQRDYDYYGDGNTLCSVNFSDGSINYYGKFKNGNIPTTPIKKEMFNKPTDYINHVFRFISEYKNRGVVIQIKDVTTDNVYVELSCVDGSETAPFVLYDKYFIYSTTAVNILRIDVITNNYVGECKCMIYGDSITYGQGNSINDTWSYKLVNYLGNSFVSGLSGGTIDQVLNRLETENYSQVPLYTIVCIGTNGGNSETKLIELIEKILNIKSIPILCTTPQLMNHIGLSSTNQLIINVAAMYNLNVIRFDIATSLNYNIDNGRDVNLFIDSVHPNSDGHERMYKRIFIDYPELL